MTVRSTDPLVDFSAKGFGLKAQPYKMTVRSTDPLVDFSAKGLD